jgi:murein DD-endopeptidase MepM/ murein hydrolase activator NlpD
MYKGYMQRQGILAVDTSAEKKVVNSLYGIDADSFIVESGTIGRNQNMGEVLMDYNLPERSMAQLILYCGSVFDMRKIHAGNPFTVFLSKDSLSQLKYLVYEHTPIDYVVFDFTDSVTVTLKQKEITTIQKRAEGIISTSLWDAITENSINPNVALQLSDIYAWTVDFFGLQKGDHFSVIYDELFVDTVSVGLGQIYGASFNFGGKDIMAIPFMQDSIVSFFDQDGNSLKRAFLKAPLKFSRISSRFSGSRMHPVLKIRRPHYGVDYAAATGTPVHTIGDGRVIQVSYQEGGGGRYVKIKHNSVYTTTYMHLSAYAKGLRAGQFVRQGDLIGYVGSSGLASGPHLDFRVFKNGSPIDPLKMESPPVSPVKTENLQAFHAVRMDITNILHGIESDKMGQVQNLPASNGTNPQALGIGD